MKLKILYPLALAAGLVAALAGAVTEAPKLLKAHWQDADIRLEWAMSNAAASQVESFEVERVADGVTNVFTLNPFKLRRWYVKADEKDGFVWKDKAPPANVRHVYSVRAITENGQSPPSESWIVEACWPP
jgi:hypothetical protein